MSNVSKFFGKKTKTTKVKSPEPNTDRVKIDGVWVTYKVCSCCTTDKKGNKPKTKHRWFVYEGEDDLQPIQGALSWESLCQVRGWKPA